MSDKTDGYFVSSLPPGEGLWGFVGEYVRKKKGLEISYLRYAQSFGDLIGCVWKICGLDFELFRARNFIDWANKSLGGLGRKCPWYFKKKKRGSVKDIMSN